MSFNKCLREASFVSQSMVSQLQFSCIINVIEKNWYMLVHCVTKNNKTFEKIKKRHPEVFWKKGVLNNFSEFAGKHLR